MNREERVRAAIEGREPRAHDTNRLCGVPFQTLGKYIRRIICPPHHIKYLFPGMIRYMRASI